MDFGHLPFRHDCNFMKGDGKYLLLVPAFSLEPLSIINIKKFFKVKIESLCLFWNLTYKNASASRPLAHVYARLYL